MGDRLATKKVQSDPSSGSQASSGLETLTLQPLRMPEVMPFFAGVRAAPYGRLLEVAA